MYVCMCVYIDASIRVCWIDSLEWVRCDSADCVIMYDLQSTTGECLEDITVAESMNERSICGQ